MVSPLSVLAGGLYFTNNNGKRQYYFIPNQGSDMATEFPGFSSPAASTEAPLEMLAACHHRIERQCTTLKRLVPHLREHGSDEQAQSAAVAIRSEEHTSELQSLMRNSYAVFCLKKKKTHTPHYQQ